MDRASSKHGPRLDEEMAREVKGHTQGMPGGARAQEGREPEPPADGEPEASWVTGAHQDPETPGERNADRRERRSMIGKYLTRSEFPTDAAGVVAAAERAHAPDEVLAELRALGTDQRFENLAELWTALGLHIDERF